MTTGRYAMSFDGTSSSGTVADRAYVPSGYVGLGIETGQPRASRSFSLGLRFEVGYELVAGMSFDARPQVPDDGLARLPVASASLGTIDTSGLSFRFGIVGRF